MIIHSNLSKIDHVGLYLSMLLQAKISINRLCTNTSANAMDGLFSMETNLDSSYQVLKTLANQWKIIFCFENSINSLKMVITERFSSYSKGLKHVQTVTLCMSVADHLLLNVKQNV